MDIVDIIEGIYEAESLKKAVDIYEQSRKYESTFDEKSLENRLIQMINDVLLGDIKKYPQQKCEYVDNLFCQNFKNDVYKNKEENVGKSAVLKAFGKNNCFYDDLSVYRENTVENFNNILEKSVNKTVSGGYVHKAVDNLPVNVKKSEVINNFNPMEENINNLQNFCSDKKDYIPQAMEKNYTNSDNSSSININMGGITQNITGQNGEDILDMLVEKLIRGINTGGEMYR